MNKYVKICLHGLKPVSQIRQMPTWVDYVIYLHPQTSTNKVYEVLSAESMKPDAFKVFNNIKLSTI